jgi:hypothetical protein
MSRSDAEETPSQAARAQKHQAEAPKLQSATDAFGSEVFSCSLQEHFQLILNHWSHSVSLFSRSMNSREIFARQNLSLEPETKSGMCVRK